MRLSIIKFTEMFFRHLKQIRAFFKVGSMQAAVEGNTLRFPGS